jgi:hypothetical protein
MVSFFPKLQTQLCSALALGCLLCGVTLAQEITTTTSHAPGIDFSKYHTYRWVEVKGQHPDSTLDAEIKQTVDSQLLTKGLTKTNDATADLGVDYQTAISQKQEWQSYEDWTQTGLPGQNMTQHRQLIIDVGTLVIDMYDTAGKLLVWRGKAEKAIDVHSSQEERQKNLHNAAKQLLKSFPPK